MASDEKIELIDDIAGNIGEASDALSELSIGSDERLVEAKIYDMQVKTALQAERQNAELEIEREKLEIERSKVKAEKATLWCKVGIAAAEFGSGVALGLLYLKANLKYGGMMGKDAKKWFDDLKHIKL